MRMRNAKLKAFGWAFERALPANHLSEQLVVWLPCVLSKRLSRFSLTHSMMKGFAIACS